MLKKKAETEIPPPFDLAVPILTDSGCFFAPFSRPVASMWRHFGTPWLLVRLPKGVPGPSHGFILVPLGLHLASMDGSLQQGPNFVPFFHGFWLPFWLHFASILDPKSRLGPMQNRIDFLTDLLPHLRTMAAGPL